MDKIYLAVKQHDVDGDIPLKSFGTLEKALAHAKTCAIEYAKKHNEPEPEQQESKFSSGEVDISWVCNWGVSFGAEPLDFEL